MKMDEDLMGTLLSTGGSSSVIGTSAITLTYPEKVADTATNGTSTSAAGSVNSLNGSSESELGKETLGVIIVGAFIAGITAPPVIYVKTKNDAPFDLMEKRANEVYDKYNKNHIPSDQRGKGIIIADNPETATICNEIVNKTFANKDHLILNIKSLSLAIEETLVKYDLSVEDKKRLEDTASLLKELDDAFTKKKKITLSTKDNEILSFILDSFRKHQENKKSNAKKLVKEKE